MKPVRVYVTDAQGRRRWVLSHADGRHTLPDGTKLTLRQPGAWLVSERGERFAVLERRGR